MPKKLPHDAVYVRLKYSPIHGVGVFAIKEISQGTNIFADDSGKIIWLDKRDFEKLDGEIRKLYDDFCIVKNGRYGCPKSFNNLTLSWYINEPTAGQAPNVICNRNYDFIAARDIAIGEELTAD